MILYFFRFKGPKEVYEGHRHMMTYKDRKARLVIEKTEPTDAGRYRCEAYNQCGRVETGAKLLVHGESAEISFELRIISELRVPNSGFQRSQVQRVLNSFRVMMSGSWKFDSPSNESLLKIVFSSCCE